MKTKQQPVVEISREDKIKHIKKNIDLRMLRYIRSTIKSLSFGGIPFWSTINAVVHKTQVEKRVVIWIYHLTDWEVSKIDKRDVKVMTANDSLALELF